MADHIFYVDDREESLSSKTDLLAREAPHLTVRAFSEAALALEALTRTPPALLVTSLRMEGMSGQALALAARELISSLPVIVMAAHGGVEIGDALRGRSLVEYLGEPVQIESLIASIGRLLASDEGDAGAISLSKLMDLIQIYTLSSTKGALSISRGSESGTIWFDRGKIVHAVCHRRSGVTAVYELLTWRSCEFLLNTTAPSPAERTINASWQVILLEGCRRLHEAESDFALLDLSEKDLPATQGTLSGEVARGVLIPRPTSATRPPRRQAKTDAILRKVLVSSENPPHSSVSDRIHQECSLKVVEHLGQLTTISGFLGATVFNTTTQSLIGAVEREGSFTNFEATIAGNAEVLTLIRATLNDLRLEDPIEDLVISQHEQCHLMRPLNQTDESFVCLIFKKKLGNLAIARFRLAEVVQELGGMDLPISVPDVDVNLPALMLTH